MRRARWAVVLLALGSSPASALAPDREARAVLDRWLEAQNTGRFEDYEVFYADDFTGVRRSGDRTATFDRKGWMQDRQRMFGKPMTVAADNVHIFASERSARIVFTQRWSSGRYADVGPKQLILRRGPAGFRIVREELFASDKRKPGTIDLEAFRRFAFVLDGEVVVSMDADDAWAAGPPILEKPGRDPMSLRSRRAVDTTKLPAEVAKLPGLPVRLMDARGVRCEAKLGEFLLRGKVFTDPGTDAEEAWAEGSHFLVARVAGDRKACAGATWTRAAALPMPVIATAEPPSAELMSLALAAFKALPESAEIQSLYGGWYAGEHPHSRRPPPLWFQRSRQKPIVRVIRPASGPPLLSVSALVAEGDCANGVDNALWALWEMDGANPAHPHLVLRNQPTVDMTLQPTAAIDIDGDGTPELLFDRSTDHASDNASGQPDFLERGIARALGGSYVEIAGPKTPIDFCPC
jgi:hypothetical protein